MTNPFWRLKHVHVYDTFVCLPVRVALVFNLLHCACGAKKVFPTK